MKKKLLAALFILCIGMLLFGALTVSARTYGNFLYKTYNGEVTITDCSIGVTSVTIPATIDGEPVIAIDRYAFTNCKQLQSVAILGNVTSIENCAFYGCDSLKSITIPDSVTSIGVNAFAFCSMLSDVYYGGTETEWNQISIGDGNIKLAKARIHFNEYEVIYQLDENGALFRGGAEVTVLSEQLEQGSYSYQVIPDSGYEIDSVTIKSGETTRSVILNANNEFEVTISEDMTIAVVFREKTAAPQISTDSTIFPDTVTEGGITYPAYIVFATITDMERVNGYGMYLNYPGGRIKLEGLTDEAMMNLLAKSYGKFGFRVFGKALNGKTIFLLPYITVDGVEFTGAETEELTYQ